MPAQISCDKCPLRKQMGFRPFDERELAFMLKFKTGELVVDPGSTILLESNRSPHLYTILDGWAFRHKSLEDGRRQILNFALPGDMVGLQMAIMDEMQHTVTALSEVTLCVFQRDKMWTVFKDFPALSFSMTWLAAREEQLLDGHLLSMGQRTAVERAAYLILHLYDRCEVAGLAGNNAMPCPFNQTHLSEALGITPVHTSRTLRKLNQRGLIRWTKDSLIIAERDELEHIASYERPNSEDKRPLI